MIVNIHSQRRMPVCFFFPLRIYQIFSWKKPNASSILSCRNHLQRHKDRKSFSFFLMVSCFFLHIHSTMQKYENFSVGRWSKSVLFGRKVSSTLFIHEFSN